MSRIQTAPSRSIPDDPILWFARLVRADQERDYPLALLMLDQLEKAGWDVRRITRNRRPSQRKEAVR